MQVHSGGVLRATPHYVRAPSSPAAAGVARNTLAVFMQPDVFEPMNMPQGGSLFAVYADSVAQYGVLNKTKRNCPLWQGSLRLPRLLLMQMPACRGPRCGRGSSGSWAVAAWADIRRVYQSHTPEILWEHVKAGSGTFC